MEMINCSVKNCSHNNDGCCYANRVNIGGMAANTAEKTCCGSFLNESVYSYLTNNAYGHNTCDSLVCNVETCIHNDNCLCKLDSINVNGDNPSLYTETCCSSFESK